MGGKIRVLKDVGGGLRGSTSGLRFNPREAPEFTEEDRNLGRDDPESKEREDEKKRKEKEAREKKIHGLHHLNLKIPKKRGARGDNQRNDEELSEMTGAVSSTGYPVDVASGAKTGGGSAMGGPNIMTGIPLDISGDIISKRAMSRVKSGIKTIENKLQSDRHKKSTRKQKQMGKDVITARHNNSTRLNVHNTRNPERINRIRLGTGKRTLSSKHLPKTVVLTRGRHRGGKRLLTAQDNPQKRLQKTHRSQASRMGVTGLGYTIPTPFAAGGSLGTGSGNTFASANSLKKRNTALHGPTILRGPKQPGVKGGMQNLIAQPQITAPSATATATASPLLASSYDDPESYLQDMLLKGALSGADITELKMLIRELRRMLRSGGLKKAGLEDAEHDDERPTPNSHRLTTSSPTGATEIDPDDDPRFWGAHPIGLLSPRRGHQ